MIPALSLATAIVALTFEAAWGYPPALFRRIGHPVTWIGALLAWLDRRLNRQADGFSRRRLAGFGALAGILVATGGAAVLLQALAFATFGIVPAIIVLGLLGSSCVAQRSLDAHVDAVRRALQGKPLPHMPPQGDQKAGPLEADPLAAGRAAVGMIVGRDTAALDEAGIARAAIESLAENFADGIVAPALFLALAGLPGGLLYKAVNTADSMIGHKTPRYAAFGFAAARLDDILNWPAARLAALWIVMAAALTPGARAAEAWRIMRRDARGHPSPNAGWPEAAMAGALNVRLGGPRAYGGASVDDAAMGDGGAADTVAIGRALALYRRACGLNAAAIALAAAVAILIIAPNR